MKFLPIFSLLMLLFPAISAQSEILNCIPRKGSNGASIYELTVAKKMPNGMEYISAKYSRELPKGFKHEKESYKEFITRMATTHGLLFLNMLALGLIYAENSITTQRNNEMHKERVPNSKNTSANLRSGIIALSISSAAIPKCVQFFSDLKEGRRTKSVPE